MTALYHGTTWQDDLAQAIGNTPLIKLRRASEATGCTILGKAEFMNPGGSVKDRAGLAIIEDAERRGLLAPGGTVVEGTAGNTGIGLTLVANARGYRSVIVMPETQSREKIEFLRMIGADERLQNGFLLFQRGSQIDEFQAALLKHIFHTPLLVRRESQPADPKRIHPPLTIRSGCIRPGSARCDACRRSACTASTGRAPGAMAPRCRRSISR